MMELSGYAITMDTILSVIAWVCYIGLIIGVWRQVKSLVFAGIVGVITIYLYSLL